MKTPFAIGSKQWPGISKLIEEAGEVQQVCGKLLGTGGERAHWDGSDLKLRLEEEIADLQAALLFVQTSNGLDRLRIEKRAEEKLIKFLEWHESGDPTPTGGTDG